MALIVYTLCALTSLLCAVLLLRAWRARRMPLLFWSGLCFVCFFLNNAVLLLDRFVVAQHDLALARAVPSLVGVAVLLYGLVWDS